MIAARRNKFGRFCKLSLCTISESLSLMRYLWVVEVDDDGDDDEGIRHWEAVVGKLHPICKVKRRQQLKLQRRPSLAGVVDGAVVVPAAVAVTVALERYQQTPEAHPRLRSRMGIRALYPLEVVPRKKDCSADDRSRRAVSRGRNCCCVQSCVRVASRAPASFQPAVLRAGS